MTMQRAVQTASLSMKELSPSQTDEASETTNSCMGPSMYHGSIGIPRTLQLIAEAGSICRHLEYNQRPELRVYLICQRWHVSSHEFRVSS